MAHYFLKANLDGVEIEFNTKDKSIVQSQLDEYFELITGKSPAPKLFEAKSIEPKAQFENFESFKLNVENQPQQNDIVEEKKPFSFESYENQKLEEPAFEPKIEEAKAIVEPQQLEEKPVEITESTQTTQTPEATTFGDIFRAKSANLEEKSAIEYENIEIQKENIVVEKQESGLDLYQPKKTPELPEFMQNKVSKSIFDDFIITAYFIKNVLNEKKFTIKYLNSKLYRAKEKLVDFAILNESISRGLIQMLDATEYGKEYCLTELGDNYYLGLENK